MLNKADHIFYQNIKNILENGTFSEQARPKYKDGREANSKYITGVFAEYDLSKGEFPITTLRPIPIKSAIKEMHWIYVSQTNSLDILEDVYGVKYWSEWQVKDQPANNGDERSIGERYGAIVRKHNIMDKILKQLESNPYNRRNVISLWDYEAFDRTDGLYPCAYNIMFDVRKVNGEMYLDCTLTQRSNDMLVAHHINAMQYVALQLMVAKHFNWKPGKFFYFVNNLHIYDNQFEIAEELMRRYEEQLKFDTETKETQIRKFMTESNMSHESAKTHVEKRIAELETKTYLTLNCEDGLDFYKIQPDDFQLYNYTPIKPQLSFDLAI